jgi:hypothetical protein
MTPLHPPRSRAILQKSRPGFLLIELILGMTLLVLFLGAFAITLIEGQIGTQTSGNRVRGTEQSQLALEAIYNIRDEGFALLGTGGTFGTAIHPTTGRWVLSGSQVISTGGYLTTLTISTIATDTMFLRTHTAWQISPTRTSEIFLSGIVTNWPKSRSVRNWSSVTLTGSYFDGGNPNFNALIVAGNYLYASSDSAGNGLYVFDVTNPSTPSYLSTTFTLGFNAYGIAIRGSTLYILTSDTSAELKAYDITTPATPTLITSKNLPDTATHHAIAVYGKYLLVGASTMGPVARASSSSREGLFSKLFPRAEAATICFSSTGGLINCASLSSAPASSAAASTSSAPSEPAIPAGHDFLVFDIGSAGQIRFLSSLNASGVNSIALPGTAAYLASDNGTGELRVVDVDDLTNVAFVSGSVGGGPQGGYNITGTPRGTAVTTAGTSAILGTSFVSGVQEFVDFDIELKGLPPPPPPAPKSYYASGSVVGVAADPTRCYGFVATKRKDETLQILKIRDASISVLTTYTTPPPGNFGSRALYYDPVRDLLYLANRKGFFILSPGAGANNCP